jgi:hypothetical protein
MTKLYNNLRDEDIEYIVHLYFSFGLLVTK